MRKAKKILSFVLIFSLVVTLFAGLNLYNGLDDSSVYAANAENITLKVVEIGSASTTSLVTNIQAAVTNCTVDYTNYSVETFNGDTSVINDAELIVINADLAGTDLSWKAAKAIMEKVIGKNGKSARFMINSGAYGSSVTNSMIDNGGESTFNYYYRLANAGLKFDASVDNASIKNTKGSTKNIYKLFLMLNTYNNPATFYGIYMANVSTAYGINDLGQLIGWGETVASEGSLGENKQYNTWSSTSLKPYHMMNSRGDDLSSIGYKETFGLVNAGDSAKYSFNLGGCIFNGNVSSLFTNVEFKTKFAALISDAKSGTDLTIPGDVNVLIVQPNGDLSGSSIKVNESVGIDMYAQFITDNDGKVPMEGIHVDMMSMYQFNATNKKLNSSYDIIYLGAEEDGNYGSVKTAFGFSSVYAANGSKSNWSSGTEQKVNTQGNDLSANKKSELEGFNGYVVVSKALKDDTSISGTVIKNYLDNNTVHIDTNNDFSTVLADACSSVKNSRVALTVYSTPPIYNAENFFDAKGENEAADYWYKAENITADDYINGHTTSRNMKFSFKISGASSSYTVKLYLDLSGDGLFDTEKELYKTETVNANTVVDKSWNVLPDGYVGSVPWRLDVLDGSKVVDSISGMSACKKNNDDEKTKLNILQIVVDSDYNNYTNSDYKYLSQTFVIPTTAEVTAAITGHNGVKISSYNSGNATGIANIKSYFSGYLSLPIKVYNNGDKCDTKDADGYYQTTRQTYTADNSVRDSVIENASLFYYYMEKLPDYEIHTSRISLYELEHIWNNQNPDGKYGYVSYDSATGDIYYKDSENNMVKCDLLVVGFCDAMVRDGMYTMNGSQNGSINENVHTKTVEMINGYISKDHFALVGHGALSTRTDERLTAALIPTLGMTTSYTLNGKTQIGNGGNAQAIRVNEGSLTRYPYNVPITLNATNAWKPVYRLNANDSKIVGYYSAAATTRGSDEDLAYGNIVGNYFMYKRGNMTYANMGFNEGNKSGQKSTVFKLPEAVLLVNTIVSSTEPRGKKDDTPQVVPENPGVSKSTAPFYPLGSPTPTPTATAGGNEGDGEGFKDVPSGTPTPSAAPSGTGSSSTAKTATKNTYHFYVDYEVTEPTAGSSSLSSTAMTGDPYIIIGEDGKTYQRVVFTVENGPSTVEFKAGTTTLTDLVIKKKSDDSTVTTLQNNTHYYVDIPIFNSYYNDKDGIPDDKYGLQNGNNEFTIQCISTSTEDHTKKGYDDFVISRRGLFLIN